MTTHLEEEREFLLQSIRDLDAEFAAGDLGEDDYRSLRDDYTTRAAEVLRRLDGPDGSDGSDGWPSAGPLRRRPRNVRAVAAVLVLALVAGGAGYAVALTAGERSASDEATGDIAQGSVDRITRAQVLVSEGKVLEAVKVYDALLADDPANPVALAERGWLVSRVDPSLVDTGLSSVERAIAIDPTYPDAHFFRGMILWRSKGDPAGAVAAFQRGIDAKPPPDLLDTFERMKTMAAADANGGSTPP